MRLAQTKLHVDIYPRYIQLSSVLALLRVREWVGRGMIEIVGREYVLLLKSFMFCVGYLYLNNLTNT